MKCKIQCRDVRKEDLHPSILRELEKLRRERERLGDIHGLIDYTQDIILSFQPKSELAKELAEHPERAKAWSQHRFPHGEGAIQICSSGGKPSVWQDEYWIPVGLATSATAARCRDLIRQLKVDEST